MPTTFHLRVWTRFLAPVEEVWKIKTDLRHISAEFGPWLSFQTVGDAIVSPGHWDARFGLRGLALLPWPIELTEVLPGERFVDTSQNALYRRFEHQHLFEPTPDGCRYIDAVTFESALPAQKLSAILTQRVFLHRHRVAARLLPTDPQATAVSVLRVLVEAESSAT